MLVALYYSGNRTVPKPSLFDFDLPPIIVPLLELDFICEHIIKSISRAPFGPGTVTAFF